MKAMYVKGGRVSADAANDEWYTPRETAERVAAWIRDVARVPLDTPVDCPADGEQAEIPQALIRAGYHDVQAYCDLPVMPYGGLFPHRADRCAIGRGVVVTNPPFSLLCQFRAYLLESRCRYVVLSRPACLHGYAIASMGERFVAKDARAVVAAWMQNLVAPASVEPVGNVLGNCLSCECDCAHAGSLDRPLYGYGAAVKMGLGGGWCVEYTFFGLRAFTRFSARPEDQGAMKKRKDGTRNSHSD